MHKNIYPFIDIKEFFERILEEKDKALQAALIAVKEENRKTETAAEKRFELLNELRGGVATKEQVAAIQKEVNGLKERLDLLQGKSSGFTQSWGILVAVVTVTSIIVALISKLL